MMDLQEISDRLEIEALMYRFSDGIDSCDMAKYRSVFTDEIKLDYSSYRAGTIGTWTADDWVQRGANLFPGLNATSHALTNVRIELGADGNSAEVRAYVRADHAFHGHPGGEVFTVAGQYEDRLVRTPDGWRIWGKKLVVRWQEGNPDLMLDAVKRVADGNSVRG
jgi:SnoaL-like domain